MIAQLTSGHPTQRATAQRQDALATYTADENTAGQTDTQTV